MYIIEFVASRFYKFFCLLGKISMMTLEEYTYSGTEVSTAILAENPFNDFYLFFSPMNSPLLQDIVEWLTNTLRIPSDFTILECLLMAVGLSFVVIGFLRLFRIVKD